MLIFKPKHYQKEIRLLKSFLEISEVKQEYNEPAKLLCNNNWIKASCIKCISKRCINYENHEIIYKDFIFAYDKNLNVCPTNAIKWNFEEEIPEIDETLCIGCGLCAIRCPIGAIYKIDDKMKIETNLFSEYQTFPIDDMNEIKQKQFINFLLKKEWKHYFQQESEIIFQKLYTKIFNLENSSYLANILIRNILIALDHKCIIRRIGDNYTRIDAIHFTDKYIGAIEIEFGKDSLEAIRGILDDISFMHTKKKINKRDNVSIVICLSLPNKRQGYFQVIKDINKVIDLKVQTISLGALLLLLWNNSYIDLSLKEFYVDFDNMSIRNTIELKIGHKVNLSENFLGILEPEK